jgi:hypothetical protein
MNTYGNGGLIPEPSARAFPSAMAHFPAQMKDDEAQKPEVEYKQRFGDNLSHDIGGESKASQRALSRLVSSPHRLAPPQRRLATGRGRTGFDASPRLVCEPHC